MVYTGTPGSGDLTIDGNFKVSSNFNFLVGDNAVIASGQNVIAFANALTAPVSLAALVGGVLYVQSGSLIYIGGAGTVTSLAAL